MVSFKLITGNFFLSGRNPYYVKSSEIPVGGLLFVVVAFKGCQPAAIATKTLMQPNNGKSADILYLRHMNCKYWQSNIAMLFCKAK